MSESSPSQEEAVEDKIQSCKKDAYKDERVLRYLYHECKLSSRQIASKLDVHKDTINRWLSKLDIEKRSRKEAIRLRRLQKPAHLETTRQGYVRSRTKVGSGTVGFMIHRLIAVAEYGYEAVEDKVVHHKNKIPWDNRPKNLKLMDWSEHNRMHAIENESHKNLDGYRVTEWKRNEDGQFNKPKRGENNE